MASSAFVATGASAGSSQHGTCLHQYCHGWLTGPLLGTLGLPNCHASYGEVLTTAEAASLEQLGIVYMVPPSLQCCWATLRVSILPDADNFAAGSCGPCQQPQTLTQAGAVT